jgi:hypothetical protein
MQMRIYVFFWINYVSPFISMYGCYKLVHSLVLIYVIAYQINARDMHRTSNENC